LSVESFNLCIDKALQEFSDEVLGTVHEKGSDESTLKCRCH